MKTKKSKDLDFEFNRIAGEILRSKRERNNLTLEQLGKRVRGREKAFRGGKN